MKLSKLQVTSLTSDIFTICNTFNNFRANITDYLRIQGLDPKDKVLDPFYLYEGGADLTKQFNKDWILAAKVARAKGNLSSMQYAENDHRGFNLRVFGESIEEVSRAFHYIPGIPCPNKWTGNKFSQSKPLTTLLFTFGCHSDGSIKSVFAAIVDLTSRPDGKSGDWKFSDCDKAGFSTLIMTQDIFNRPNYNQIIGDLEFDYTNYGDAKKGMKLMLNKLPVTPVTTELSSVTISIAEPVAA
jgi:hypothetical protein